MMLPLVFLCGCYCYRRREEFQNARAMPAAHEQEALKRDRLPPMAPREALWGQAQGALWAAWHRGRRRLTGLLQQRSQFAQVPRELDDDDDDDE